MNDAPHQSPVPPAGELKLSLKPFSNLAESEKAPVGRFPARLWPTRSAKALTRGHRCPESPVATGETPLLIPAVPESTKLSLKALAAASAIPLRAKRAHGKPTRRLVFPSPTVRSMPSFELPHFGRGTKEKTVPKDGLFYERTLCAEYCATCRSRFHFCFG